MEIGESSPDIEVILNWLRDDTLIHSLPVNINKSRSVRELKQWLAEKFDVEVIHIKVFCEETEMLDSESILAYEVETDDELTVIDKSPQ